jgi:hypothetical protein
MNFQIGVEQAIYQQIGAEVNAIAAIRLEQDRARHQPAFHENASIESEIGADIDEDVRLDLRGAAQEIFQLVMLGDVGRDFQAPDIG